MKKIVIILSFFLASFATAQEIKWLTLNEAETLMKENPNKPLLINFYTNWCGYCKLMDARTMTDENVIEFMNETFILVKFNAEQKDEVSFLGKTFKYLEGNNGKGINSFAYFILRGQLSYPSFAIVDYEGKTKNIIKGYLEPDSFLEKLVF